ncbi:hypothetical protein I204_07053 [Kwoniella mangroviensis CBS 8886]|nr:hypothetical protein I204_07053 [Kwoniella mangroviensis CBS 8886]
MTTFLPGNTQITLLSTSLTCYTFYLLRTAHPTHVPYQFMLNFINVVSVSLYAPLILVKLFERFKLFGRSQVSHSDSHSKKKGQRESLWRRWINNSEFLLCLTLLQFALTLGFIALTFLSIYTLHLSSYPSTYSHSQDPSSDQPSRTYTIPTHRLSSSPISSIDLLPLLSSFLHLMILSMQLLSFALIIIEIRSSSRYSSIDRSLSGLLERDISDLIKLKNECDLRYSSKKWVDDAFTNGRSLSTFGMYSSPSRSTSIISGDDGTPRRRSISTTSTILGTPSSVPLCRDNPVDEGDIRFTDPFNFTNRRSSRSANGNGNRRLSVRFDLTRHLNDNQTLITPKNGYDEESQRNDYFSLPHSSSFSGIVKEKEVIRPIPLSIIKSPKNTTALGLGFSPSSSNGSETLEDILEEGPDEVEQEQGERRNSWMDIKGEQSV